MLVLVGPIQSVLSVCVAVCFDDNVAELLQFLLLPFYYNVATKP